MIDPSRITIDVAAEQAWLMSYKSETGLPWSALAERTGIAQGTISQFGPGSYKGDNDELARKVMRFRQTIEAQSELLATAPEIPGFIKTRTAEQATRLLSWAHRGRMVVIAGGPGIGKSMACRHYAESASNVWMATMSQSTSGLNPMQVEMLAAMGERDAVGTPQKLSRRICEKVRDAGGLIIIDEAQAMSERAIEEVRSWHDRTGVGLALIGNDSVLMRLEGGTRKAAYAQLYSRVSMRMIRPVALVDDVAALANVWGVTDPRQIEYLTAIGTKPGALRSVTMVMELATMLAIDDGERTMRHIQDAWKQLSTRPLAA